jgi:hypothetical protein
MKELPIAFNKLMVSALIAGIKTQTRRTNGLDGHIRPGIDNVNTIPDDWIYSDSSSDLYLFDNKYSSDRRLVKSPYRVGDLLWVREEHKVSIVGKLVICEYADGVIIEHYFKSLSIKTIKNLKKRKTLGRFQRARFLPKELSRAWLEIVEVKVERLLSITEADAEAEGVERWPSGLITHPTSYQNYLKPVEPIGFNSAAWLSAKCSYIDLWEKLNGNESVNSDPWVWAITFKVLSTTGKPVVVDQEAAAV